MKVYVYAPGGRYTFGATIVAANTPEEADALVKGVVRPEVDFIEELPGVTATGEPRILHDSSGEE